MRTRKKQPLDLVRGRTTPRLAANEKLSAWFGIAIFLPHCIGNLALLECHSIMQMGQKWHQAITIDQKRCPKTTKHQAHNNNIQRQAGTKPTNDALSGIHPIRKYQVDNGFKLYLDILFPRGLRGCTDKVAVYGRRNSVSGHDG